MLGLGPELRGREQGERHVAPSVERHLVTGVGDLADEIGRALRDLADHEERAASATIAQELEHAPGECGVALLGGVGRPVVFEVERERDEARHQYASMSRNSNVSRRSRSWSTSGWNDRRIRCNGDGWNRRGGWMPRTFTCSLNPA